MYYTLSIIFIYKNFKNHMIMSFSFHLTIMCYSENFCKGLRFPFLSQGFQFSLFLKLTDPFTITEIMWNCTFYLLTVFCTTPPLAEHGETENSTSFLSTDYCSRYVTG
ncbi:hypothetical protein XENOCAPTIV_017849 [Xenoophorus captivus]|uniref:Uncharacterized protein n=1 Tax=Xenoophorus captivus TaxID=1517983 RepID=A0ABV0QSF7_9TELE